MTRDQKSWEIAGRDWLPGDSGPLHAAVLFVDLVGSTDAASMLGLEEYAAYERAFEEICLEQCRYFFEVVRSDRVQLDGRHLRIEHRGDELAVFLHTDRPHDDIYQLTCFAIALKCAWLSAPLNGRRIDSGRACFEIGCGIHSGPIWATRQDDRFEYRGFAINLAKRTESASRSGERFRIFVSDSAFKQLNRRMRNLLFGPRRVELLAGISSPVGLHELHDSFVDPARRMAPERAKAFLEIAEKALATNTFDFWIHSCLQIARSHNGSLSDDSLTLCERVLSIEPSNAVALYCAGEAEEARGNLNLARLYLEDLTSSWPQLGDGWLSLSRIYESLKLEDDAARARLQAVRYGIPESETEPALE